MGKEIGIQSITFVFAKLIHTCFCIFFLTRYVLTMKNELKCMLSKNSNEVVGHYKESHALHDGINGWAFVEKKNLRPMCIMWIHWMKNTINVAQFILSRFRQRPKKIRFTEPKGFFYFKNFIFTSSISMNDADWDSCALYNVYSIDFHDLYKPLLFF